MREGNVALIGQQLSLMRGTPSAFTPIHGGVRLCLLFNVVARIFWMERIKVSITGQNSQSRQPDDNKARHCCLAYQQLPLGYLLRSSHEPRDSPVISYLLLLSLR